jgi:hypothetical protein
MRLDLCPPSALLFIKSTFYGCYQTGKIYEVLLIKTCYKTKCTHVQFLHICFKQGEVNFKNYQIYVLMSITQKKVPRAVVYYYYDWFIFLRNRLY